jgi:GxxExxY protein
VLHKNITHVIINAFYTVYNALGYGFLETVYENALVHELKKRDLRVRSQHPVQVYYDDQLIGEYFADLLVDDRVLVELKSVERLGGEHTAQLINYLKATDVEVGLLFNFGPKPTFVRKIFTNDLKTHGQPRRIKM